MKRLTIKPPGKRALRIIVPLAFVLVLAGSVVFRQLVHIRVPGPLHGGQSAASTDDYKKSLKAQVDNADGSPASGRDPSAQAQTTLADAASRPNGTGLYNAKPAAGVTGTTGVKATPSQVYSAQQQQTGINDAGCFYDYGVPGQECVYAHLADANGKLTCSAVRSHFPDGVKVSGSDRFHLDANHDGMACDAGDN